MMLVYPLVVEGKHRFLGRAGVPLDVVLYFLDQHRKLSKEEAVAYVWDVYRENISAVSGMKDLFWSTKRNYRRCYQTHNPPAEIDDGSRSYFVRIGRKYYVNFLNDVGISSLFDEIKPDYSGGDVHHIIPLACGGNNSFENLILLSPNNHHIIETNGHQLPKAAYRQAVDYLFYLHQEMGRLMEKYKLDETLPSARDYVLIKEMQNFYGLFKVDEMV